MNFILHGDNTVFLRDLIFKIQKKVGAESRIELDVQTTPTSALRMICSSFDIFSTPPFVVLDITKGSNIDKDAFTENILQIPAETTLILYSSKTLPKSSVWIKKADHIKAKIFEGKEAPTTNMFKFLDHLFVKDRQIAYKELQNLLKAGEDPFYIFSMILYSLRSITSLKLQAPSSHKMQGFVRTKFIKQSEKFSELDLTSAYKYMALLDEQAKSGKISSDNMLSLAVEKFLS